MDETAACKQLLIDVMENLSVPGVGRGDPVREIYHSVCKGCGMVNGHADQCRFHEFKTRAIALGVWPLTRI